MALLQVRSVGLPPATEYGGAFLLYPVLFPLFTFLSESMKIPADVFCKRLMVPSSPVSDQWENYGDLNIPSAKPLS